MLTPNQIISYSPSSTISKGTLTEYYQHELLDSFFKQKGSENYSFIGGTAVRIAYSGQRFSEDLDFDTTNLTSFDELMRATIADMSAKGFQIESRLVHKGAYHCYLKFPHVLKELGLSGYQDEKLLIKMDAAPISTLFTRTYLLNNYGIFQTIKVAPIDILLSKKLLTIMSRKRPKGRDLYDVTYLWGLSEPNQEYLDRVGHTTLPALLREILVYVQKLDLKDMAQEVAAFLINASDSLRVLHFGEFLETKINQISKPHHP